MENKYIALRIYNNFDWITVLRKLENHGYEWFSKEKLTKIHQEVRRGCLFLHLDSKQIHYSYNPEEINHYCNYYIEVQ